MGSIPNGVTGIFLPALWPLTEISASNTSWGDKDGQCIGLRVLKSGSFNLLEPSWPVQACTGIA